MDKDTVDEFKHFTLLLTVAQFSSFCSAFTVGLSPKNLLYEEDTCFRCVTFFIAENLC